MTRTRPVRHLDGSSAGTHLPADDQSAELRAERRTRALVYLTRSGNADLAGPLGLAEVPNPCPRCGAELPDDAAGRREHDRAEGVRPDLVKLIPRSRPVRYQREGQR